MRRLSQNISMVWIASVIAWVTICFLGECRLFAETPPGLLTLAPESLTAPPERNWERLGIRDSELRILERFHRGGGYEGFHVAYKSMKLNLTGILARPYIRDEETKYPAIVLNHGSPNGVSGAYRAIALDLARRGYVVLAASYRGRGGLEGRSQGVAEFAKGEVIDVLQLTQLGRKLPYVDSQRMGVAGEGHGATVTIHAIGRSNVFQAAVAISPPLFSGMAEYGYAGLARLRQISLELLGREWTQSDLIRELRSRESFRNISRIRTPLLLITTDADASYPEQVSFVNALKRYKIQHRFLEYPGMFPGFMTAPDDGSRPPGWDGTRDIAWGQVFRFLDERLMPPPAEVASAAK